MLVVGCTPSKNTRPPLQPDNGAQGAGAASGSAGAPGGPSPAATALAWLLGPWTCDAYHRPDPSAPEAHVQARLVADAYMDVWVGAGFEPETPTPGIPKGDFYVTLDRGLHALALVGFTSDGARYTLTSPGELEGRTEWTGSITHGGPPAELRATWTHKGETELEMRTDRRVHGAWETARLSCHR